MQNNFIDELLDKANIVDIIGRYVKLHKSGANYFGCCPFHDEKTASFCVSGKKKIWKCFGCKKSGNVITFIQQYHKISFGQAIKEVAKMCGYSEEDINKYFSKANKSYSETNLRLFGVNNDANDIFKALLFNEDNKKYLQYLYDRKLSKDSIEKFDIGFCGKNNAPRIICDLLTNKEINSSAKWNEDDLLKTSLININDRTSEITDYLHNRITFPIKDKNGFIVAFIARDINTDTELKYLTSRETTLFNKSNTLYNFDKVYSARPETLIVLEGNIDLISLYEAGLNEDKYGAVALMGVALTPAHIKTLRDVGFVKNILLWFDNDNAGKASTITNGKRLLEAGFNVLVINNTTKYKDVNDILVHEGKQLVLDLVMDVNKPDFITYYINNLLTDVTSTNLTSKVNELLLMIRTYGSQLLWDKYCKLIASKTNLSIDSLITTLKSLAPQRRFNNYGYLDKPKSSQPILINPLIRNLVNSYIQLLNMLFYDPTLAGDAYDELEYKGNEVEQVQDFVLLVKYLAVSSFEPNNPIGQIELLVDDLFKQQKISEWFYKIVKSNIADQKIAYKNANLNFTVTKSKCIATAQFINSYYDELIMMQLKYKLSNETDANKKSKLQSRVNELTHKINEFKKHRKTKYHI